MDRSVVTSVRNESVDIAKGVGIFFVVLGHNYFLMSNYLKIQEVIYSFHMPLFFFLSGIYIKSKSDFKGFVIGRIDGILKPYIFGVIIIGLVFAKYIVDDWRHYWAGAIYGTYFSLSRYNFPLWFLPALFFSSIVAWLVINVRGNNINEGKYLIVTSTLMLLLGCVFIHLLYPYSSSAVRGGHGIADWYVHGAPWGIDVAPIIAAYMIAGYAFRKEVLNVAWSWVRFAGVAVFFISLFLFFPDSLDLARKRYDNILITSLKAFSGVYVVILVSSFLCRKKYLSILLSYYGKISLTILLFHAAIQVVLGEYFMSVNLGWRKIGIVSLILNFVLCALLHELISRTRILSVLLQPRKRLGTAAARDVVSASL